MSSLKVSDDIELSIELRDFYTPQECRTRHVVCVLYDNKTDSEEQWQFLACSQPCPVDSPNLQLVNGVPFSYIFELTQAIRIDICSYAGGVPGTVIATTIFKIGELVGSFGMQLRKPMHQSASLATALAISLRPPPAVFGRLGCALISAQLPEKRCQPVLVQFQGKSIERNQLLWDETAVFFRVFRLEPNPNGKVDSDMIRTLLYESEAIQNHSHPVWKQFELAVHDIADDRNRLLEIQVLYRDVDGREASIGKCLTTYAKMKYGVGENNVYKIVNEVKKKEKKSYENSGTLELTLFTDVSFYNFLDYIVSGTQLHYEIAVDFSERIWCAEEEKTKVDAQIQTAIRGIGAILRDYTPNRLFPAYGLGARVPPLAEDSHEFTLNFCDDAACRGLDGVLEAYKRTQLLVAPAETACYAPIIKRITKMAEESGTRGLHYHVAVVFTRGGPIDDLKEAISAASAISAVPLSILFVSVGAPGDYAPIHKLVSKARAHLPRQCVEFIDLSKLLACSASPAEIRSHIAERVLKRVPSEMVGYMHERQIPAKPPIQVCRSPLFHASFLIPDRPTECYVLPEAPSAAERPWSSRTKQSDSSSSFLMPPVVQTARRGSDGQFLHAEKMERLSPSYNCTGLTVRLPERSRSVLQTTRERFMERLATRRGHDDVTRRGHDDVTRRSQDTWRPSHPPDPDDDVIDDDADKRQLLD